MMVLTVSTNICFESREKLWEKYFMGVIACFLTETCIHYSWYSPIGLHNKSQKSNTFLTDLSIDLNLKNLTVVHNILIDCTTGKHHPQYTLEHY